MARDARDEEVKKMVEVIWTAPIQQVLSVAIMLKSYPINLTRIKLGNAIDHRRYAEFCRSLEKNKEAANKSSFWDFLKFWGRKAD